MGTIPNGSIHERRRGEGFLSAVAVGGFFILLGIVYIAAPNLLSDANKFFKDFTALQVPGTSIQLPAPANPASHAELYGAVAEFTLGMSILQVVLLALSLALQSSTRRTGETVGNLVFWFGATYLIMTLLNDTTTVKTWFIFWAAIVMVWGASMIARALFLLARRRTI